MTSDVPPEVGTRDAVTNAHRIIRSGDALCDALEPRSETGTAPGRRSRTKKGNASELRDAAHAATREALAETSPGTGTTLGRPLGTAEARREVRGDCGWFPPEVWEAFAAPRLVVVFRGEYRDAGDGVVTPGSRTGGTRAGRERPRWSPLGARGAHAATEKPRSVLLAPRQARKQRGGLDSEGVDAEEVVRAEALRTGLGSLAGAPRRRTRGRDSRSVRLRGSPGGSWWWPGRGELRDARARRDWPGLGAGLSPWPTVVVAVIEAHVEQAGQKGRTVEEGRAARGDGRATNGAQAVAEGPRSRWSGFSPNPRPRATAGDHPDDEGARRWLSPRSCGCSRGRHRRAGGRPAARRRVVAEAMASAALAAAPAPAAVSVHQDDCCRSAGS